MSGSCATGSARNRRGRRPKVTRKLRQAELPAARNLTTWPGTAAANVPSVRSDHGGLGGKATAIQRARKSTGRAAKRDEKTNWKKEPSTNSPAVNIIDRQTCRKMTSRPGGVSVSIFRSSFRSGEILVNKGRIFMRVCRPDLYCVRFLVNQAMRARSRHGHPRCNLFGQQRSGTRSPSTGCSSPGGFGSLMLG